MKISVIIRTKNEEKYIGKVLSKLSYQSMKDFEVIIVDSISTDKTINIVNNFSNKLNIKIININSEKFTYPYACNLGTKKSIGKYLCFLSGHSIPRFNNFLEKGMELLNINHKIAGVYGPVLPLDNSSLIEKIFYSFGYFQRIDRVVHKPSMGVLGNTNSIIPKILWKKYNFDEKYIGGGEDYHWAKHFLNENYTIIKSPNLAVYHSHGFGIIKFIKQWIRWKQSLTE